MTEQPDWLAESRLAPQSYGIACGQGQRYGRPRGIWLECKGCDRNDVIVGSNSDEWAARPTSDAALVFRKWGWTGEGEEMKGQLCPDCSKVELSRAQVLQALALIDDMSRHVGGMALQDYAAFNEVPMNLRKALRGDEG